MTDGSMKPGPNDVVMHVRRTQISGEDTKIPYKIGNDFLEVGSDRIRFDTIARDHVRHLVYGEYVWANEDLLPMEWYRGILDKIEFDRLYICTDCPQDEYLNYFSSYEPRIVGYDCIDAFNIIRSAARVICSISTFSWWAAFLSQACEIFLPVLSYSTWGSKSSVRLEVDDESRYIFVPVIRDGGTLF
jgi:hypothetical protein